MANPALLQPALNEEITTFLLDRGAIRVGFANPETLKGGPPSVDLDYVFRERNIDVPARSAITFAIPMDLDAIRLYLAKKDRAPHMALNGSNFARTMQLSHDLAELLRGWGFEALGTAACAKYRTELPNYNRYLPPDISHKYIALASGVGTMGFSGNVGLKGFGTNIGLGTTVTSAELEPTAALPDDENFCEWKLSGGKSCKLCARSCPTEMFDKHDAEYVQVGENSYAYAKRKNTRRCEFGCGGFTGLHPSGKWSSWSPGRFKLSKDPVKINRTFMRAIQQNMQAPRIEGSRDVEGYPGLSMITSCGMCQLVCFGDKKETAYNHKLLTQSGCVVQEPDGNLLILSPEEAKKKLEEMPEEHAALYS